MIFRASYFLLTVLLFFTEVLIALFVHDTIIRPYIGDVLVVILVYCFVKTFFNTPVVATAIAVLVFACCIELLQYFHFVKLLGLQHNKLANVVLGNSFAWEDLLAYVAGTAITISVEKLARKWNVRKQ